MDLVISLPMVNFHNFSHFFTEISLMRVRSSSLDSISTVRLGDMKPHPLSQAHSSSADDIASNLTNQGIPSDSNASTIDGDTSADSLSVSCEGDSPKERGFTQSLPVAIERKISMGSKDTPAGDKGRRDLDCFSDNFIPTPENHQTVSIAALVNGEVGVGWGV